MGNFEEVSRTLGSVKPETRSVAHEIYDAAAAAGHDIWAMWGYDGNAGNTEHHSGLALDLMVRNSSAGNWIRKYVWDNRERLRLRHVIWSQHITSTVTQPGVVRLMEDRGSTTNNHYDHNHVLLFPGTYQPPGGSSNNPPSGGNKSISQVAASVLRGDYGNGDERRRKLTSEGYDYDEVQAEVRRQMGNPTNPSTPPKKSVSEIATEVLAGKWGNGTDRVGRLNEAGYNPGEVQAEVNRRSKSISKLADEVIARKWGDGEDRRNRLTEAGYDYDAVQREVNRRYR
jgi:hypothetical protein